MKKSLAIALALVMTLGVFITPALASPQDGQKNVSSAVERQGVGLSGSLAMDYLKDKSLKDILNVVVRQGNVLKLVFPDGNEFLLKTGINNLNVDGEVNLGEGCWIVFNFKGNLNPNNSKFRVEYRGPVFYVWTDNMEVGDTLIDAQHKELIEMTNDLLVACYYGQPPSKLHDMLLEIANESVQHFLDEEQLMLTVGYPGYNEHKQIHDGFLAVVIGALALVETEGPSADLISAIATTVGNWVMDHILQADVRINP
jgi:hemerythrin